MNLKQKFNDARDGLYTKQAVLATVLMASPLAALAAVDPSTEIVAEIEKGKGYGIAAAVAFAVAVWAITSIHMARRKG